MVKSSQVDDNTIKECGAANRAATPLTRGLGSSFEYEKILGRERFPLEWDLTRRKSRYSRAPIRVPDIGRETKNKVDDYDV